VVAADGKKETNQLAWPHSVTTGETEQTG